MSDVRSVTPKIRSLKKTRVVTRVGRPILRGTKHINRGGSSKSRIILMMEESLRDEEVGYFFILRNGTIKNSVGTK